MSLSGQADPALKRLNFTLPENKIAQVGASPRDSSRLMVVGENSTDHARFYNLSTFLRPNDLLVFNESKVIPARVIAQKPTGGKIEVLLLREEEHLLWSAYLKPAKRAGDILYLGEHLAHVVGVMKDGARLLRFEYDIKPHLDSIGRLPLPPYIAAGDSDEVWQERYQTVYAKHSGSVAAPTAGLHFTHELLEQLHAHGVSQAKITLHVGAGTFRPISGLVSDHTMHAERYEISPEAADLINNARSEGRRVVAVGTTTVRTLESAWDGSKVVCGSGETAIFIKPGTKINVPDMLITNFHLPDSTLLLLVAAFAGENRIKSAYQEALAGDYKFYSLGDAMLLNNTSR